MSRTTNDNNQSPTDVLVHNGELNHRWLKVKNSDEVEIITTYHDKKFEEKQTFELSSDYYDAIDKHSEETLEHQHKDGWTEFDILDGETQRDIMRTLTLRKTEKVYPQS